MTHISNACVSVLTVILVLLLLMGASEQPNSIYTQSVEMEESDSLTDSTIEKPIKATIKYIPLPVVINEGNISKASAYSDDELDLLAHLIFAEAGSDYISDEAQRAVAQVVINRVNSKYFPDNIHDVIYEKGQYQCTWNGMINYEYNQRALDNARYVLDGKYKEMPDNVIWQAGFKQGHGLWKEIDGIKFCYSNLD